MCMKDVNLLKCPLHQMFQAHSWCLPSLLHYDMLYFIYLQDLRFLKNLLRRNLTYTTNDALQNVYISFHMAIWISMINFWQVLQVFGKIHVKTTSTTCKRQNYINYKFILDTCKKLHLVTKLAIIFLISTKRLTKRSIHLFKVFAAHTA